MKLTGKEKIDSTVELPNFYIIGAPKCGTTALSEYLREHQDIFFAHPKEPTFFNTDFSDKYRRFTTLEEYLNHCFYKSKGYKRIGEGTVWHLYSKEAIPHILEFTPDAKFIVMLRNPVDMSYALHATELMGTSEDVKDFKTAWNLLESRKKGQNIPPSCKEIQTLYYDEVCMVGEQIDRLFQLVPRDKVKIIFFEDFVKDTLGVYKEVLDYLDLAYDGRTNFPKHNQNKEYKNKSIAKVFAFISRFNQIGMIKKKLGLKTGKGPIKSLAKLNQREVKRKPLDQEFREELMDFFKPDVQLLEKTINKDLSHWYNK